MNIASDIFIWFKLVLNDASDYHQIKEDGEQIESRISKLEQIFNYYNEEKALTRKAPSNKIERKSYLKEVVGTTRQAYEVLNRMARYQNDLHNLNYNLIFQIKLELDSLTPITNKF